MNNSIRQKSCEFAVSFFFTVTMLMIVRLYECECLWVSLCKCEYIVVYVACDHSTHGYCWLKIMCTRCIVNEASRSKRNQLPCQCHLLQKFNKYKFIFKAFAIPMLNVRIFHRFFFSKKTRNFSIFFLIDNEIIISVYE